MPEEGSISIEQFLLTRLSKSDFKKWVDKACSDQSTLSVGGYCHRS